MYSTGLIQVVSTSRFLRTRYHMCMLCRRRCFILVIDGFYSFTCILFCSSMALLTPRDAHKCLAGPPGSVTCIRLLVDTRLIILRLFYLVNFQFLGSSCIGWWLLYSVGIMTHSDRLYNRCHYVCLQDVQR